MYKIKFKSGQSTITRELLYNDKGEIRGFLRDNIFGVPCFSSTEEVEQIDELVPRKIWPLSSEPAPEKRPFKVGDRVKVVSLENTELEFGLKVQMKIGNELEFVTMINEIALLLSDGSTYHPDDLAHID